MGYRNVSRPPELVQELDELGEKLGLGYSSSADAVKDAMRRRIEELRAAVINRKHIKKAAEAAQAEAN